jgi:hypothetical protein
MRLFRQDRAGDWAPVVARVEAGLRALAGGEALRRACHRALERPAPQ